MKAFALGGRVSLDDLDEVSRGRPVVLRPGARARVAAARRVLERILASGEVVYGVNTGFGELSLRRIPADSIRVLQLNLVRSHACGVGPPLAPEESLAIVFLRANELARGHSGCRPGLVALLAGMVNRGLAPVIPSQGSVGASGDLAPQAHMALAAIGEGMVLWKGRRLKASEALKRAGLKPAALEAKEGLSLVNGTQAMQAVGGLAVLRALRVLGAADAAGAMSLEALRGTPSPFEPDVVGLKAHPGQLETAARLRRLLRGSEIRESHRRGDPRVQDPYSLRCMPQVHGTVRDALRQARAAVETEMAGVTDNPVVVRGRILSGGNFHGQALALAYDMSAVALAALGNISERRTAQLVAGKEGLPPFLAQRPGLESGFMIAQVTAAALASENKVLAHPASADTVPTSANQEDHVSMGMGAALKLARVVDNAARITAIELIVAAQALERRRPLKAGAGVEEAYEAVRARAPRVKGDESLSGRIEAMRDLVLSGGLG